MRKGSLQSSRQGAGSQFDPELVEIFFNRYDIIRSIQKRYLEEE